MNAVAFLGLLLACLQGYLASLIFIREEKIFQRLLLSAGLAISIAVLIGIVLGFFGIFSLNALVIVFALLNGTLVLVLFSRQIVTRFIKKRLHKLSSTNKHKNATKKNFKKINTSSNS